MQNKKRNNLELDYYLDDELYKIIVKYTSKTKKTYRMKMTIDKKIEMSIYKGYDINTIIKFLDKNSDWIKSSSAKYDKYIDYLNDTLGIDISELLNAKSYLYLGKIYENNGNGFNYGLFLEEKEKKEKVLTNLYKLKTFDLDNPPNLVIKKLKGKWGSYNRVKHEITLNLYLLIFDVEMINYVIDHELIHIKVFNHSKNFYYELSKRCPNYKKIKEKMKILSLVSERLVALK